MGYEHAAHMVHKTYAESLSVVDNMKYNLFLTRIIFQNEN